MPHAVHIALAVELGAEDADSAEASKDGKHMNIQHRVSNRCGGNGFRSQAPHHNVIQQGDKAGNKLLHNDRNQQRQYRSVKAPAANQFLEQRSIPPFIIASASFGILRRMSGSCRLKKISSFVFIKNSRVASLSRPYPAVLLFCRPGLMIVSLTGSSGRQRSPHPCISRRTVQRSSSRQWFPERSQDPNPSEYRSAACKSAL